MNHTRTADQGQIPPSILFPSNDCHTMDQELEFFLLVPKKMVNKL